MSEAAETPTDAMLVSGRWVPAVITLFSFSISAWDPIHISANTTLKCFQVASFETVFDSTLHDPVYHYRSVFGSPAWQERMVTPPFPACELDSLL